MRKHFNIVFTFDLKNTTSVFKVSILKDLIASEKCFKRTVWLCYHKRHIINVKSNGNHKPPISKTVGYGLDQRDVIRIATAV